MEKIKEILLIIPVFLILYPLLCLIVASLISVYRFVVKKESFRENVKDWFIELFLEIFNPFNYFF
ncbi:hypothetical protein [Enterococcus sp. 5B3_DIV0040]|uniref:hypothetical protein n=1 Tax=Enterococcus sp. 5B3_DIV0040 TaxID=1834182 RepID=UPI000A332901|nr:hypothetical protein [Enterococcus sp. 5B3_DIV0040]OTO02212.1 hypothetical protein A5883_003039 [Enterococcus sp. 5B3_DIV0040]OTO03210.1 hypothetical protein A5883_000175 [Enterococcus sp. 5B3_DIV0040]